MKARILTIVGIIVLTLAMVTVSLALAQGPGTGDEPTEAEREAEAAVAAEAEANTGRDQRSTFKLAVTQPLTAPLFVGISQPASQAYVIDPATSDAYPLFDGAEIWGAAYDYDNDRLFFNRGTTLFEWPLAGTPVQLGTIRSDESNAALAIFGLAYANGKLFATRGLESSADPEGIYTIDPVTLKATLVITYSTGAASIDMGGLAADPKTGTLYGTNDQVALRGLVQIDPNGDVTVLAPYPDGETDIDGLAVDGSHAYLVTDEPGDIYVFDFETLTYTTPITNPWTSAELFAGAGWIPSEPITPSISLTKTVGLEPDDCATETDLAVSTETLPVEVVYCYTVKNTGELTLTLHDLQDSALGSLEEGLEYELTPGASVSITQTASLTQSTVNTATWTAYNVGPTDIATATASAEVLITLLTPTIHVNPTELAVTAGQNTISTRQMTIENTGTANLTWTLDTFGECYGVEPGWISFDPVSGTTEEAESSKVTVRFNSAGLSPGTYTHVRCVKSNDPETKYTPVEFRFRVQGYSSWFPIVGK